MPREFVQTAEFAPLIPEPIHHSVCVIVSQGAIAQTENKRNFFTHESGDE
jgi:hypothetical protein